ncbi:hypothetical protein TSTA_053190 [Talaromyces stipitatus ATCC 10500]|uniref:Uncharacterized protein n=1 Tax=Talaromyces stipitatus (strain ATCC 10500 / CBS 375.48 / QM 6759 / NRRL 1006) TaxID=441959 RepID=B8MQW6_TALSN|nr:uncharacterized protein TSTA_053190 [Talaromyces stipitatus ATCC 10500]EED12801.1 hypothetical protein TSTA_053190 [Talaromyces stipitatus ATCC 10500]
MRGCPIDKALHKRGSDQSPTCSSHSSHDLGSNRSNAGLPPHPKAKGERFICIGEGCASLLDIAKILKKNLGPKTRTVPATVLSNLFIQAVAISLPVTRLVLPDLGVKKAFSSTKSKGLLGWTWKYNHEQEIIASAEGLHKFRLIKA